MLAAFTLYLYGFYIHMTFVTQYEWLNIPRYLRAMGVAGELYSQKPWLLNVTVLLPTLLLTPVILMKLIERQNKINNNL
jgi:hypothetical protein